MIIRHAEKPIGDERAIDVVGSPSDADLIVRGWQRAGALVCFFAPTHGPLQDASLAVPKFVFASWPKGEDPAPGVHGSEKPKSHRPRHTVESLCAKLNLKLNAEFSKGQEKEVAEAAMACPGPVLISWQHESIPGILNALPGGEAGPKSWPGERFDVVYVLTWDAGAKKYRFSQVPQMLLAGDLATGIAG
jgi:hypothetical protein